MSDTTHPSITDAEFRQHWWGLDKDQQRALVLTELRKLNIKLVEAEYDGSGDDGNVEHVQLQPMPKDEAQRANRAAVTSLLCDFVWDFAYSLQPGFENNDGAWGTFEWTVETDNINLSHHARYVDHDTTEYEDL